MDTVILQFRTAMFGFNRKDVQQYMEHSADTHRQELTRLQEQLERAEKRNSELEAALSGAESEKSGAAAEEARVRASLEESTHTLSKLRGELSQTESKLVVARQELERLKSQVGTMKPMAENYAQLKERVATVELDAHRKAQHTVDEAQEEAERIRADTRAWLDGVLDQYSQFRREMDSLAAQARVLGEIPARMRAMDDIARGLLETVRPEQPRSDT